MKEGTATDAELWQLSETFFPMPENDLYKPGDVDLEEMIWVVNEKRSAFVKGYYAALSTIPIIAGYRAKEASLSGQGKEGEEDKLWDKIFSIATIPRHSRSAEILNNLKKQFTIKRKP